MIMNSPIFIAIAAGLASSGLLLSFGSGSVLAIILVFLAPLPIAVTALGWGMLTGMQAGLVGFAAVLLFTNKVSVAGGYVLIVVLPYLILSHLVYLSRQSSTPGDEDTPSVEWYPVGRLIVWMAVFAGVLTAFIVFSYGFSMEAYQKSLSPAIDKFIEMARKPQDLSLTAKDIEKIKYTFAHYIPISLGISFLMHIAMNFWAGAVITFRSERLARPWPDVKSMEYPNFFVVGFAIALAVAVFVPGMTRLIALGFIASFLIAAIMLGLTVIHTVTENLEVRLPLLISVYLCLLLLFIPTGIIIAILGVGEPIFKLRQRALDKRPIN